LYYLGERSIIYFTRLSRKNRLIPRRQLLMLSIINYSPSTNCSLVVADAGTVSKVGTNSFANAVKRLVQPGAKPFVPSGPLGETNMTKMTTEDEYKTDCYKIKRTPTNNYLCHK